MRMIAPKGFEISGVTWRLHGFILGHRALHAFATNKRQVLLRKRFWGLFDSLYDWRRPLRIAGRPRRRRRPS